MLIQRGLCHIVASGVPATKGMLLWLERHPEYHNLLTLSCVAHPEFIGIYASAEQFQVNIEKLKEIGKATGLQVETDWLRKSGGQTKIPIKKLQLVVKKPAYKYVPVQTSGGKKARRAEYYYVHQEQLRVKQRNYYNRHKDDPAFKTKNRARTKKTYDLKSKDPIWMAIQRAANRKSVAKYGHTARFKARKVRSAQKSQARKRAAGLPLKKFRRCDPCGKWVESNPTPWKQMWDEDKGIRATNPSTDEKAYETLNAVAANSTEDWEKDTLERISRIVQK
ncbi:hypothetical protein NA57DRAFT_77202 [Rhizodiscina lignyota]|uniref:Uncharacterized protein n=1 Tax=Rhizodiscina lignyota TaxID=1504668 RepID=A0A9P4M606_9PEZI|nr:hypothetical protein NA57DRAFT_77202 [Rhizodiscina lignyota]